MKYQIEITESPSAFEIQKHSEALLRYGRAQDPRFSRNTYYSIEMKAVDGAPVAGAFFVKHFKLISIEAFWVDKAFQKQNLGHELFLEIEKRAIEEGCEFIVGSTLDLYKGALEFWKKQGGSILGTLEFDDGKKLYYIEKRIV